MDDLTKLMPFSIPPWAVAALGGVVYAAWDSIKGWLHTASTYLLEHRVLDPDLGFALMDRLVHHPDPKVRTPLSQFGRRGYLLKNVQVQDGGFRWIISRWMPHSDNILWYRWKFLKLPLIIGVDGKMDFRFIRGTLALDKYLDELLQYVNTFAGLRFKVHRLGGSSSQMVSTGEGDNRKSRVQESDQSREGFFNRFYRGVGVLGATRQELQPYIPEGGPEDLWCSDVVQEVLQDVRSWFKARKWFLSRHLSWKRGYLLAGKPGTGKSSLVRAIAIDLDLPVYLFDLGSMNNSDLDTAWESVRSNSPCVVLFEDIDAVYHGRNPANPSELRNTPPTFDWLLNRLDGVDQEANGVLTFITSNNPLLVDTALGGRLQPDGVELAEGMTARPGRVDRVVTLPDSISPEGKAFLARRLIQDPALEAEILKSADPVTPAQFQERCIQVAREASYRLFDEKGAE